MGGCGSRGRRFVQGHRRRLIASCALGPTRRVQKPRGAAACNRCRHSCAPPKRAWFALRLMDSADCRCHDFDAHAAYARNTWKFLNTPRTSSSRPSRPHPAGRRGRCWPHGRVGQCRDRHSIEPGLIRHPEVADVLAKRTRRLATSIASVGQTISGSMRGTGSTVS